MNDICKSCSHVRSCLNGRYCTLVGRYVEYLDIPICETNALFESASVGLEYPQEAK